jgi:hypothetical protein
LLSHCITHVASVLLTTCPCGCHTEPGMHRRIPWLYLTPCGAMRQ